MKFVALGGGHGTAVTLRALRALSSDVTGIVSVADDGGSTGRLRAMLNVAAVGDLRKCLGALADPKNALAQAFEHRFSVGELEGHTVGNLLLVGLIESTGNLELAVDAVATALGVSGTILPASRDGVVLQASHEFGITRGQTAVARQAGIHFLSLDPPLAPAPPRALRALEEADVIVIGPGSLYTSVLAACVVPQINSALALSAARKIYVANLRPEKPETIGLSLQDHVDALRAHGVDPTDVLVDAHSQFAQQACSLHTIITPLSERNPLVHDVSKLTSAVLDAVQTKPERF
jgi:uncharacterized cofD-like protein